MTDLTPCPFCGNRRNYFNADAPNFTRRYWTVKCDVCDVQGPPFSVNSEGEAEAIAAWNTRAAPRTAGDVGELVERLTGRAQFCRDKGGIKSPEVMEEAAARITALSAEVERLSCGLHSIANNGCCDQCQEAAKVAKHILTGPHVPQAALGAKP